MADRKMRASEASFVDTPRGIFTAAGVWFRATQKDVEAYAGEVLAHEPIGRLITRAEVWLRSPQTLALWMLPVFMVFMGSLAAAPGTLVVFILWKILGPGLVAYPLAYLFRVLDLVWLQGLYYVALLSGFAAAGRYAAVWIGLGGFILLRWGLVERGTSPIVRPIWRVLYALPVPDQALRAFIVRAALVHRVALPQLDELERSVRERWFGAGGRKPPR